METLEDLLAEDGFKRLGSKPRPGLRGGTASAAILSRDSSLTYPRIGSSGSRMHPERTRSNVISRRSSSIMLERGGFTDPRPSYSSGRKLSSVDLYEEHSLDVQNRKCTHSLFLKGSMESGGSPGKYHWHVNNVEELDRSPSSRRSSCSKDGYSEKIHEKLGHYRRYNNVLFDVDEKKRETTTSFPVKTDIKTVTDECPVPSLDDASSKAITSILNSFVNQLIEDESFRSSINQSCVSSLKSGVVKDKRMLKDGVISTFKEAIGAVERIITDGFNQLEIKKTSLKLSVISGLTSMKSDDGHTSGIANSHLAACAHLYLSILYKIQKKDKVSAKHLLQVFCDSPHSARTTLLPELWDRVFLPHLSHLNAWYDEKVESVQGTSGMIMKLEHLDKVYNDVLDVGTCQFSAYYKDWLMDDNKSPSLPSIAIPFVSFPEKNASVAVESVSSRDSVPSHIMISRSLYESILSPSKRMGTADEMESEEEEDVKYDEDETDDGHSNILRRFDGFDQEDEEARNQSPNSGTYSAEGLQEYHITGSRNSDAYSEMTEETCTEYLMDEIDSTNRLSNSRSIKESSRIPLDFTCPLTGMLLKDPVTLESGFTFERVAIKERFDQGNKTCPITGQTLKCSYIPETNIVLKQMINEWIAECFKDFLALSSQDTSSTLQEHCNNNFNMPLFLIEQLLAGFSVVEEKENIQLLISLGGLLFLTKMIELGSLEDQSHAAKLLVRCIRASGCCRNYIAMNISIPFLIELIKSKEVGARNNAVLLLIELIGLKSSRIEIMSFLSGLKTDAICETMHELLACLQCSVPEERVLIAVLLLQFAQMEETQKFSGYRKEAVNCIMVALDYCLSNSKFIENCRRALLMLGGHFFSSGEILTELWLLKQAGYNVFSSSFTEEDDLIVSKEESKERENWLKGMALILLGYGKKLFVETLSKCLNSANPDLVRVCLVTTAWLSRALASLSLTAFQVSAFLVIFPRLKQNLMNDLDIKDRVLASLCLLNFSRISEFRIPIITFADEIHDPLKSLAKVTWTARHLYEDIFAETL